MNRLLFKLESLINSPLAFYKIVFILIGRSVLKSFFLLGFFIDSVFLGRYKKVKINKPVFLIGHPRSGTTFLHRFLLDINSNYKGMHLWEMLLPSLFLRNVSKPLIKLIDKKSNKQLYDTRIHTTGLLKAETDDVALFFKSFEGLFFWLYFAAFTQYENQEMLDSELIKTSDIEKTIRNLNILHAKNLSSKSDIGKTMFSKSFSLILNIEKLLESFPSAKVILLMRNPMEVIPSSMSLSKNVLQKIYDFEKMDEKLIQNYYNNLYSASIVFYKSLHKAIQNLKHRRDQVIIVKYKNLKTDFLNEFKLITDFLEIEQSTKIMEKLEIQENKQKSFKSEHKYALEDFGMDKEKLERDFNFIYDNYDV